LVFTIYFAGYAIARHTHLLVHAKGYMTKDGERVVAEHRIRQGDLGEPISSPLQAISGSIASTIYAPIKLLETQYHKLNEPFGTPW